ncbi:MAG: C25 family cysteine peptidase, partial [Melioribacteraceae bacterium]
SFDNLEYKPLKIKPVIEVLGYLWIDKIYCTHLRINQYGYNDVEKIVNEINKIEINVETDKSILNLSLSEKNIQTNKQILNLPIINNMYAEKYKQENIKNVQVDSVHNWIDYSSQYLKIGTALDGIYRLNKNSLDGENIQTNSIDPRTFKIFLFGKEIPIYVEGQGDGIFDGSDFIEFVGERNMGGNHRVLSEYGEPYNEYLGRYTDTTVYWLTWGSGNGQRVKVNSSFDSSADTLDYYGEVIHTEKNAWFDFSASSQVRREHPFWFEYKTWHEGNINVGIKNKSFSVSDVVPNKNFKMFIKTRDFVSNISTNAHQVSLGLNSDSWSTPTFINKYEKIVLQSELNSNLLDDGNNILNINSAPTNANINVLLFDWYEVEYPRYLIPINSELKFSFPFITSVQERNIKLQNTISDSFSLWKYGDSYEKYSTARVDSRVSFADTVSNISKFIFMDESRILTPKIYYVKQFKNLRSTQNKADYIAITHKDFITKTNEYTQFISTHYSVDVMVVDVEDIYDEYSFGLFNPEAIKEFLKSSHSNWKAPSPKFVSLIGGATYDYYGNKFYNVSSVTERVKNYVPSFGAPVSDNWFVTWDTTGAYIPQMNIGRIPVTTNEELDWYFEKHQNYVQQDYDEWNKRYIFFSSGDASNSNELNSLRASNNFVIENYVNKIPVGGKAVHFFKTTEPSTNFGPFSSSYFQEEIDKGAVFISYSGHSGTQIWDNSITKPSQLANNSNRYPIVSDFGCSTGKFAEPDVDSFSELFTTGENGQALGYLGNSSLGYLSTSVAMVKIFFKKLLNENIVNVSEAHKQAKLELLQTNGSSSIYKLFSLTNTLIGDPIISLPIPEKPNFVIKQKNIKFSSEQIIDLQDSIGINILVQNLGNVSSDSIDILIVRSFQGVGDSVLIRKKMTVYEDTLRVKFLVKNKAGKHTLNIDLDSKNLFDELREDDNETQIIFNVSSSAIRPFVQNQFENGLKDSLVILNPTSIPNSEKILFEIADNNDFENQQVFTIPFDSLYTKFKLPILLNNKRYWGRMKIFGTNNFSSNFSFFLSKNNQVFMDSLSLTKLKFENVRLVENKIFLDSSIVKFHLLSAGFEDGQAAIISRNNTPHIPTPKVGHHIVLFHDERPHEFVKYKYFNTDGGEQVITKYIQFLDTLSTNFLVAIAVSDNGRISDVDLKNQIKSLGSQYIDKVGWRSSWAFIGKKGAETGTMPEIYSTRGKGSVTIDSVITFNYKEGKITTPEIGSTGKWKELTVNQETPSNSKIIYTPIGIKTDGSLDTLVQLNLSDSTADLSHIDAKIYPKIKIFADFTSSDDKQSPILKSLGVDYDMVSELAINYQVVSIEQDTLEQGDDANLSFYVYNVGESTADSFKVQVEVIKPDNSREKIFEQLVDSLGAEKRKQFKVAYNTINFNGARTFSISIDTEDKILELYEDNNFYTIPFYVKGDTTKPTMQLTVDGNDIFEGEYISSTPKIKIEMSEPSPIPITDTNSVNLFLNNKRISYKGNEDVIAISYSQSNPKVTVDYTPQLEDGEYEMKIFGKDASGNVVDSSGISKSFVVANDAKIMEIYNYPNPMTDETYFTFKLTQIPDEVKIRIFTIAGRMIKEIVLDSGELNFDLNKIYWDGLDTDGDEIGNGVYLYKVIMDVNGEKQVETKKLAVVK